jgi:hypothetical protein
MSLAVLLGASPVAANAQAPTTEQCLAPATCPISYVRLAKQETEPFLFLGKVVDVNHPRYGDYERALRRFPDVRSCLTTDEREKPQPDLREIDWDAIGDVKEMEVCVFRIVSSIGDIGTIKIWFQHHDFSVAEENRFRTQRYVSDYDTDPIFSLETTLSVKNYRKIIPRSWFARLIGLEGRRSAGLTMYFSQSWQVVGVAAGGSTILN